MTLRTDLQIISEWIEPDTHILDLGCGNGTLLRHLRDTRRTLGYGLEIDGGNIIQCLRSQINVIQIDLDTGLSDFGNNAFDYVIMTQALQVVHFPEQLLQEMLRVGRQVIVTFPNFGHWQCRLQLGLKGRMPMSRTLPIPWFKTPNIHLCTVKDFEILCRQKKIQILRRMVVDSSHQSSLGMRLLPNLLGEIALYQVRKGL